ncbi:MAG: thioredoxin-disulfide reductase [Thaumarchaeota archaeon]|nr:thioredoxin-disulfide reductase [Nitrososphaerota archaeon]
MIAKLVIIGSGPAGLTAAIYAARAKLHPIVITGFQWGGQLMLTTVVENFPGFIEGLMGPQLMDQMRKQAERFGAEFIDDDVSKVELTNGTKKVHVGDKVIESHAIILATGASAQWLGLESEKKLIGRGVSSCATCDAFFFKDKEVVVIGGGDSAMEDSLYLTKFASKVTIIHRRDKLKASKIMQDRAFANPKISFIWNSAVIDVLGKDKLEGVVIQNVADGKTSTIQCQGMFVAIGHKPNTDFVKGQIELDHKGYVVRKKWSQTHVEGVFVAGDVHDYRYKQAITAAGYGCEAALDAEKYLEAKGIE